MEGFIGKILQSLALGLSSDYTSSPKGLRLREYLEGSMEKRNIMRAAFILDR